MFLDMAARNPNKARTLFIGAKKNVYAVMN
jgi:hypothetical protein